MEWQKGLASLCAIVLEEARDRDLKNRVHTRVWGLIDGVKETLSKGRASATDEIDNGIVMFLTRFVNILR